jgi:hypothetical protein
VITEATWMAQGAGPVVGVVVVAGAICLVANRLMHSDAKPRPASLSGVYLPTIAIQPDGSIYVREDKPRLGGATQAPRLRKPVGEVK